MRRLYNFRLVFSYCLCSAEPSAAFSLAAVSIYMLLFSCLRPGRGARRIFKRLMYAGRAEEQEEERRHCCRGSSGADGPIADRFAPLSPRPIAAASRLRRRLCCRKKPVAHSRGLPHWAPTGLLFMCWRLFTDEKSGNRACGCGSLHVFPAVGRGRYA